jgi:transcriptional regulator GlxA family with amidase domain
MADLSVSQFEIRFAKIFQTTPKKFIIKTRVKASCEGLIKSRASINLIALDYGFYDQSHFSNQFTGLIGITPRQYRQRYADQ